MDDALVTDFIRTFDDSYYPESFRKHYEPMELLSTGQLGETMLVKHRQTGEYFITKCYNNSNNPSGINETQVLKDMSHWGVPYLVEEARNEEITCVVREYVQGTPLDKLVYDKPLTENQAVAICIQLCDILIYIHKKNPPVIHRDIKP